MVWLSYDKRITGEAAFDLSGNPTYRDLAVSEDKLRVADDTSTTFGPAPLRSSWLASSFTCGYAITSSFLGQ